MANYFIASWPVKDPRKEVLDSLEKGSGEKYVVVSGKTNYTDSWIKEKIKNYTVAFRIWGSRNKIGKVIGFNWRPCIALALLNRLLPFRRMKITMSMFAFYHSSSRIKDRIKIFLFRRALYSKSVDNVVVHSRIEAETFSSIFPKARGKFKYMPVGVSMPDPQLTNVKGGG